MKCFVNAKMNHLCSTVQTGLGKVELCSLASLHAVKRISVLKLPQNIPPIENHNEKIYKRYMCYNEKIRLCKWNLGFFRFPSSIFELNLIEKLTASICQALKSDTFFRNLSETVNQITEVGIETTVNSPWAMDSLLVDLQFIFISFVCLTGIPE